jgi:hypothetical protein
MALQLISLEEAIELGLGEASFLIQTEVKRPLAARPVSTDRKSRKLVRSSCGEKEQAAELPGARQANR